MKKPFSVQKVSSPRFQAIVFSLDASRPETYFDKLEKELKKLGASGSVLLDLLACNGSTSRRFFAVEFDGEKLNRRSFRVEPAGALDVEMTACTTFYAAAAPKLSGSVLSSTSRKLLAA